MSLEKLEEAIKIVDGEAIEPKEKEVINLGNDSVLPEEVFQRTLKEIQEMNFIEIKKFRRDTKEQLDSLEAAKLIIESIKNGEASSDLNFELENVKDNSGVENIDAFLEGYEETSAKFSKLLAAADEKIIELDSVKKSTSYLTNSMLEIINKNIAKLESITTDENKSKLAVLAIRYNNYKNIISNRTDIEWITEEIKKRSKEIKRLQTSLKKNPRNLKSTQKHVCKILLKAFSVAQLETVEKYLQELFGDDVSSFYLQYAMAIIFEQEKKFGKYNKEKYVEMIVLNIVDISVNMFDLPEGKEGYDKKLLQLRDTIIEIIK